MFIKSELIKMLGMSVPNAPQGLMPGAASKSFLFFWGFILLYLDMKRERCCLDIRCLSEFSWLRPFKLLRNKLWPQGRRNKSLGYKSSR